MRAHTVTWLALQLFMSHSFGHLLRIGFLHKPFHWKPTMDKKATKRKKPLRQ